MAIHPEVLPIKRDQGAVLLGVVESNSSLKVLSGQDWLSEEPQAGS
jgi:hypothetical protein